LTGFAAWSVVVFSLSSLFAIFSSVRVRRSIGSRHATAQVQQIVDPIG
jgi:hypothetical protein